MEVCPPDVDAECPLETFRGHVECSKQEIIVSESFKLNPGKYGNDQYDTFREFIRNVAQAYGSAIVLVKG